jgi:hypothetical protein
MFIEEQDLDISLISELSRYSLAKLGLQISLPIISRFSKAYQLNSFSKETYNRIIDEFYSDDFLYVDCSNSFLLEDDQFNLYSFLCELDQKGVLWSLYTPAFHLFLKEFYVHDYHVVESYCINSKGVEHKCLSVSNYLISS